MDSNKLRPPPASAQGRSVINARVEGFRLIVVPPAATTFGETLGHSVPGESPVEAKNTTPDLINLESKLVSPENSPLPQLLETSPPPAAATRVAALVSAVSRLVRLFDAASTRMILALGAIACAHSMSRDSSSSHPPVGSWGGRPTRPDYGEAPTREQQLDIGVGPDSDISGALDIRLGRNHFTPGRPMLGKAGIC